MTYADITDDLIATLGQGIDDAVLDPAWVMHNVIICADRLKKQRLEKELRSGQGSRGSTDQLTKFLVPVSQETYLNDRNYFSLPSEIYDIKLNGGIEYIVYHRDGGCKDNLVGRHFTLSTPSEIDTLNGSFMQRPSETYPYYFRSRLNDGTSVYTDRVWLIGVTPQIESVEVGLYLTLGNIEDNDPDEEVDLPADMIYLLKRMVMDVSRWKLLTPQEQLKNDGRHYDQQPFQPPQGTSINDPVNNTGA
jgi:hypothetical protein